MKRTDAEVLEALHAEFKESNPEDPEPTDEMYIQWLEEQLVALIHATEKLMEQF